MLCGRIGLEQRPSSRISSAAEASPVLRRCQLLRPRTPSRGQSSSNQRNKMLNVAQRHCPAERSTEALSSSAGADRTPEAHSLLGECRFRAAREAGANSPSMRTGGFDNFGCFPVPASDLMHPDVS